jgi:hypothetical protein
MARPYTVAFSKVEVEKAVDVFEIRPAANKRLEVTGLFIGQSSDFGDAQAEILPYKVVRGNTTSGSGGTTPTPTPIDPNDPAAGFSAETNNTTAASSGTPVDLHDSVFNVAMGEALWLPPGEGWRVHAGNTSLVVRLGTAPNDPLTLSGTLYVLED